MCSPSACVVLKIVEIHQRRLREVVVGEIQMADLRRKHRLGASRQRGVANGQSFVVLEVASLLLIGERVAAQVHRQDQIGLLDDLLAVELEVREVQKQRIALGRGGLEIPAVILEKAVRLRMQPEVVVVRDDDRSWRHRASWRPPPRRRPAGRQARAGARPRRPRPAGSAAPSGSCRRCCRRPRCTHRGRSPRRSGTDRQRRDVPTTATTWRSPRAARSPPRGQMLRRRSRLCT